jgi:hypothetical protein
MSEHTEASLRAALLEVLREKHAERNIDRAMALDAVERDIASDLIALLGGPGYSRVLGSVFRELDRPRLDAARARLAAMPPEKDYGPPEALFDEDE